MIIRSAQLFLCEVPLNSPFVISRGAVCAFTNVVLALEDSEGRIGWGEAVPVSLTEDPYAFYAILEQHLIPRICGADIHDITEIIDELKPICLGFEPALAAIDLALWDLAGKAAGQSVTQLLGGDSTQAIGVDYTMGAMARMETVARAQDVIAKGYGGVVVKITCTDVSEDIAKIRAVCDALPRTRSIRVDANGGFDVETAKKFIDQIADLPIEFLEQPVKAADIAGLKACRGRGIAIAADEALKLPEDAARLIEAEACDVLNLKVTKAGGIVQSMRVARMAEAADLPLVIGGGLTYGISRFASQHIAASTRATAGICHQGPGPASQALSGDLTLPRLTPATMAGSNGVLFAPTTAGLGFDILPQALRNFTLKNRNF